jgi:hypothetical protein
LIGHNRSFRQADSFEAHTISLSSDNSKKEADDDDDDARSYEGGKVYFEEQ